MFENMTSFVQKRGINNSRKFILSTDKIIVESKTAREKLKYTVKLDDIGYDIYYKADSTLAGKIFLLVCLGIIIGMWIAFLLGKAELPTAIIVSVILGFISLLNVLTINQDDVCLSGGPKTLCFYRNKPNEEAVSAFIDKVIRTSKEFVKNKYSKIDISIPEDIFRARLDWLMELEIITDNERSYLLNKYSTEKLFD